MDKEGQIMEKEYTALERVLTAIGHKEPDRVPLLLLLSLYGAREMELTPEKYFAKAENIVKMQLKMRKKYNNDCIYTFFYSSIETEAFGGDTIFIDNGPPNSGRPIIRNFDQINKLEPPKITESAGLMKVLDATQQLKKEVADSVPVIGVVMSPFSLPVMQMGFDKYLDLMHESKDLFEKLMQVNTAFCVEWANAQLEAGATAICYFDPVSSPSIIPREMYLNTGFRIAQQTIAQIKGPTATHFASGRVLAILDDVVKTGTAIAGISTLENLNVLKQASTGKITLLGNLNGIEMCNWTPAQAENEVKNIISEAGKGGGLLLSDNHGEIPYQVSENVLLAISDAVRKWGKYPLDWVNNL